MLWRLSCDGWRDAHTALETLGLCAVERVVRGIIRCIERVHTIVDDMVFYCAITTEASAAMVLFW